MVAGLFVSAVGEVQKEREGGKGAYLIYLCNISMEKKEID
jgi:hypothetical protein